MSVPKVMLVLDDKIFQMIFLLPLFFFPSGEEKLQSESGASENESGSG